MSMYDACNACSKKSQVQCKTCGTQLCGRHGVEHSQNGHSIILIYKVN